MSSCIVHLELEELEFAATNGIQKRISAIKNERTHTKKLSLSPENAWMLDIQGAIAEFAVAKYLGLKWNCEVRDRLIPGQADVGDNVQVRSTNKDDGRMIVQDKDPIDHFWVLAITGKESSMNPRIRLAGWLPGSEAKVDRFWTKPKTARNLAFWIPQSELRPMAELKELCYT